MSRIRNVGDRDSMENEKCGHQSDTNKLPEWSQYYFRQTS